MHVIGLLGMPGAGKTTAMDGITEHSFQGYSIQPLQMKEIARIEYNTVNDASINYLPNEIVDQAEQENRTEELQVTGNFEEEISDWVDSVLDFDNSYFADQARRYINEESATDTENTELWVIDGIRTVADVESIQSLDAQTDFVYLHTPFHIRADRVTERDRPGEGSAMKLMERDEQEFSWGLEDILSTFDVEMFVATHDSESAFTDEFSEFVSDELLN